MQSGYRYVLVELPGRKFDPAFRPDLTPKQIYRPSSSKSKCSVECWGTYPTLSIEGFSAIGKFVAGQNTGKE